MQVFWRTDVEASDFLSIFSLWITKKHINPASESINLPEEKFASTLGSLSHFNGINQLSEDIRLMTGYDLQMLEDHAWLFV